MRIFFLVAAAALFLTGCETVSTNPYRWQYAQGHETVCLITSETNAVFIPVLRQALEDKGLIVMEPGVASCAKRLTFSSQFGGWSGIDLQKAQLVLEDAATQTHLIVESTSPAAPLETPVQDGEALIRRLVDRLFPEPSPWNPD